MNKKLRVKDIFETYKMNSLIIDENDTLSKSILKFAKQPELRRIFLIDEKRKFKGIVTRTDLLNIIKRKLGGDIGELPMRILAFESLRDMKIKDMAGMDSKNAYVEFDDPVEKALELMIKMDLVTIPVIDDEDNIVDDITLSEILFKILASPKKR